MSPSRWVHVLIATLRRITVLRRIKRSVIMAFLYARAYARLRREKALKIITRAYYSVGRGVECNICGWKGRNFKADYWHPHTVCPKCETRLRHRLIVAALTYLDDLSGVRLIENKSVLHFAPEPALEAFLRPKAANYVSADMLAPGYRHKHIDLHIDISDMHQIPDSTFDCLIACDVLEHVADHLRAIDEIYRVLRPNGCAILTVPQQDNLAKTFEDPTITTADGRIRVYGQWDHVRMYGDDFPHLLEAAGFSVAVVTAENFDTALVRRYVLFPPVLSSDPLAPNHRKIFFAMKRQMSH